MATEFEKQMYEVAKTWLAYIGEKIDSGVEPEPAPQPEPIPEPIPEPVTGDPEIIYKGQQIYNIKVGEKLNLTFYGMNISTDNEVFVEMQGIYGGCPTIKYALKETKITNGIKFDYTITALNTGDASVTMYAAKDKKDKSKWVTAKIKIR